MLVYNLTSKPLVFRGKVIPPNGGSRDYKELDNGGYIPDRDRKLETDKVLAYGKLPNWWHMEQLMKSAPAQSSASEAPTAAPMEVRSFRAEKESKKR